jgi:hypothetical protein
MPSIVTTTLVPIAVLSGDLDWTVDSVQTAELALASDDGAGSTVRSANPFPGVFPPPGHLELGMTDLPLSASPLTVTVRASAAATGGLPVRNTVRVGARLFGVDTFSMNASVSAIYGHYTAPLLRPGGGAWSVDDINNASVLVNVGTDLVEVSYVSWVVTWTQIGAITDIDRAYLTARVGAGSVGSFRVGFAPTATQGVTATAGKSPGTPGPYYVWRRRYLPSTNWMPYLPPASQR